MTYSAVLALLGALACVLAGSAVARTLGTPTVTGYSPKSGLIGNTVKFTGSDLQGAAVNFAGKPAGTVTVDPSGTSIVASVPREAVSGPNQITITFPDGTMWTSPDMFLVNETQPKTTSNLTPKIASITPLRAKAGSKVTIKGWNFGGALWVKFGGVKAATFKVPASGRIVATVPVRAHSGKISVKTKIGLATSPRAFTLLSAAT